MLKTVNNRGYQHTLLALSPVTSSLGTCFKASSMLSQTANKLLPNLRIAYWRSLEDELKHNNYILWDITSGDGTDVLHLSQETDILVLQGLDLEDWRIYENHTSASNLAFLASNSSTVGGAAVLASPGLASAVLASAAIEIEWKTKRQIRLASAFLSVTFSWGFWSSKRELKLW